MARDRHELDWSVGYAHAAADDPGEWFAAAVPGAVQLDVARARGLDRWWYADNWQDYRWMEDCWWSYRARLPESPVDGGRVVFVSRGIDYAFEVRLNGRCLHRQEGMYTPVELDLTDALAGDDELRVVIAPAPKLAGAPETHAQADRSCKPPVSYGWDWHPRLIPLGIWDETWIEIRRGPVLEHVRIRDRLDDDRESATVTLTARAEAADWTWVLLDPDGFEVEEVDGEVVEGRVDATLEVDDVRLWWPREQGDPDLYTSVLTLHDETGEVADRHERHIGFRTVRLVMNEGGWDVPGFPKSRSEPPITLEVNGRRVFAKGTNWVNPEVFWGTLTRDRYAELIDLACEANFNMLRVWGGAIVNKDAFFELCDERGLLVWQDFPLACNPYEGTPEYLAVLRQEATAIIDRAGHHPCLALWCGGNELFNAWSGMTDQSTALRLLGALTLERTPEIPFIATSPLMGMGHGHYVFRDHLTGEEVFSCMARATNTAYTEFGCAGPSPVHVLERFLPEDQRFPPRPDSTWQTHHGYGAWEAAPDSWLMLDTQRHYFGEPGSLRELVERGQLLQAEGYRCIYEEARRQWPRCSMALNWCFDEPWPCAANNSLIAWPLEPKPALQAVRQACRPQMASARVPRFRWSRGDVFTCDVFVHNDLPGELPGGRVVARVEGDTAVVIGSWEFDACAPGRNHAVGSASAALPPWRGERFRLVVEVEGRPALRSVYTLLFGEG